MDPLTQGLLGAAAAQAVCGRVLPRAAWPIGMAAGMIGDLDVFIRPADDPLGGLSYHRHFTHSLAFIPVGAVVAALPLIWWQRFAGRRRAVLLAAAVAYATHGLLDACTSFGTLLYWPFSNTRVAWDLISIIDPVFTLILLTGLIWSVLARRRPIALAGLSLAGLYLGLGARQHARALEVQRQLAEARGQHLVRGRVLPSLGSLTVWRSLYQAGELLYADTLRLPLLSGAQVRVGSATPLVTTAALRAQGYSSACVLEAVERLIWFADGYVAFDSQEAQVVGDMRYAGQSQEFASMWGLRLPPAGVEEPPQFVRLYPRRTGRMQRIWEAIRTRNGHFEPLTSALAQIRSR